MVRHHPAKFGGHKHCGGGDCDSGDMFFVANEENSRCCRNFLKDIGWKHTAYIINSDSGHTHSIGQIFENNFCQSVQSKRTDEKEKKKKQEVRDDLSFCVLNLEFVRQKIKIIGKHLF